MLEPKDYPRAAEEAFNRRDLDALAALWAPDFHYEAPDEATCTRAEAIAREQRLWTAFPDLRAALAPTLATRDRLVIEGTLRGRHDGVLRLGPASVPPTGRSVAIRFVGVFEFEAGLVRRERVYYDRLDLLRQLGLDGEGGR